MRLTKAATQVFHANQMRLFLRLFFFGSVSNIVSPPISSVHPLDFEHQDHVSSCDFKI